MFIRESCFLILKKKYNTYVRFLYFGGTLFGRVPLFYTDSQFTPSKSYFVE